MNYKVFDSLEITNLMLGQLAFLLENVNSNFYPKGGDFAKRAENTLEYLEEIMYTHNLMADGKSQKIFQELVQMYLSLLFFDIEHYLKINPQIGECTPLQWKKYKKLSGKYAIEGDYEGERVQCWVTEGYSYHSDKYTNKADRDDVVIDLGAFTGNTSLYFSEKVGEHGLVYAFEPSPATLEVLNRNLQKARFENIKIVPLALSDKEMILRFPEIIRGGNTAIKEGGVEVPATSLDIWIEKNNITKVDFIKMDIEGAEIFAINGAISTIKKYTPKMAISVYHLFEDIWQIPKRILEINPNYRICLKQPKPYLTETCMHFIPAETPLVLPDPISDLMPVKTLFMSASQAVKQICQEVKDREHV